MAQVKNTGKLQQDLAGFSIKIKESSIMPIYYASLDDFIATGVFTYTPDMSGNQQKYMCSFENEQDQYVGDGVFSTDGSNGELKMYYPRENEVESVDFNNNQNRISTLMSQKSMGLNLADTKLMWVDGLGYVYYIDNGEQQACIAAGFKGCSGEIFNEENGGIVLINDALRVKYEEFLKAAQQRTNMLNNLAPGKNPPTGAGVEAFVVDNGAYANINASPLTIGEFAARAEKNTPIQAKTNSGLFICLFVVVGCVVLGSGFLVIYKFIYRSK